jgi:hypothetical protein
VGYDSRLEDEGSRRTLEFRSLDFAAGPSSPYKILRFDSFSLEPM